MDQKLKEKLQEVVNTYIGVLGPHINKKSKTECNWIWRGNQAIMEMWGTLFAQLKDLNNKVGEMKGKTGCCPGKG